MVTVIAYVVAAKLEIKICPDPLLVADTVAPPFKLYEYNVFTCKPTKVIFPSFTVQFVGLTEVVVNVGKLLIVTVAVI